MTGVEDIPELGQGFKHPVLKLSGFFWRVAYPTVLFL